MLQLTCLRRPTVSEEEYLELAYRKTACLFSACLRLGALLGGKNEEEERRLGLYGINLGLAFQLIDDVLDFTSSEEVLGKPIGNDVREGKMTLPLIYLLQRCTPEEARKVSRVLEEGGFQLRAVCRDPRPDRPLRGAASGAGKSPGFFRQSPRFSGRLSQLALQRRFALSARISFWNGNPKIDRAPSGMKHRHETEIKLEVKDAKGTPLAPDGTGLSTHPGAPL